MRSLAGHAFSGVAAEWCALIEARDELAPGELLAQTFRLLPHLYAAAVPLLHEGSEDPEEAIRVLAENVDSHLDRLDAVAGDAGAKPGRSGEGAWFGMDRAEWLALFTELGGTFGAANRHWTVSAPLETEPSAPETSTLADELTDVYRDVRWGLRLWEEERYEEAVRAWRLGFSQHWGVHALDAVRALHALATDPPQGRDGTR